MRDPTGTITLDRMPAPGAIAHGRADLMFGDCFSMVATF